MTQQITRAMLESRCNWVTDLTKIPLQLDKNAIGWTLYVSDVGDKGRLLKQLAYHESAGDMFQTLRALYEMVATLKEQEKLAEEI